jgi:CheY-like chemotaxis protein
MNQAQQEDPLRILVVEDSALTAEQIEDVLRQIAVPTEIKIVHTENDALAVGGELLPHVIVLDLQLKQGTGFGVLREFRATVPRPNIVVLTNYALPNYRNYAFITGANFFLDKAKDMDMLPFIVTSIARERVSPSPSEE